MPLLGQLALWLAALLAVWGAGVGLGGARTGRPELRESARRATLALAAALVVAVVALVVAVARRDFRVAYVAAHADLVLPAGATVGAIVAGLGGRLLLGVCGFVLCLALARATAPAAEPRALAYADGLGAAAAALVLGFLLVGASPFRLLSYTPVDGAGLPPHLHDGAVQLAVAARCVAFGAAAIPLVWIAAGHWGGARDAAWRHASHAWALLAWALTSAVVGLGLWHEARAVAPDGLAGALRDPALLLWLGLTALVHAGPRSGTRAVAHVAHAGAAALAVSAVAATFGDRTAVQLGPGEAATVGRYTLTYVASSAYPARAAVVTQALLELQRDDRALGRAATARRQLLDAFGRERFAPAVRPAVWNGWSASVYARWEADSLGGRADFQVAVVPLARWMWAGWWVTALTGVVALWRRRAAA